MGSGLRELTSDGAGLEVATLRLPSHERHCLTVSGPDAAGAHRRLLEAARARRAVIIGEVVFAGCRHYRAFRAETGETAWPLAWLGGDPCPDGRFYALQALAVSGLAPVPVIVDKRVAGYWLEDGEARCCWLGALQPPDPGAGRPAQAGAVFRRLEEALGQCGLDFADVARTWLFIDRILDWYDGFNRARTSFFETRGVFSRTLPASTGIGAANPFGAALIACAFAARPLAGRFACRAVSSPLQPPADSYRSSFSRAVETVTPSHRCLYVSGTAAIDGAGRSACPGEADRQADLTLRVVGELLASRGMGWQDAWRGVAYFKRRADEPVFRRRLRENNIPPFPLAFTRADICRPELLLELELDAVKAA